MNDNTKQLEPVRAVSRSIAILQLINRSGSISMSRIAQSVGLPYATAHRLVQTLLHEGLVELEPDRKRYRPTELVETLSYGLKGPRHLIAAARPHIVKITKETSWPVSLVTRVGTWMMVRDSTHALAPLTLNVYYPGYTLPILGSASGLAYLAFADDDERESILATTRALSDTAHQAHDFQPLQQSLDECRARHYATKERNPHTENPGLTSSIAVPIRRAEGGLHGTLTLIYLSSAMSVRTAVERYKAALLEAAIKVENALPDDCQMR